MKEKVWRHTDYLNRMLTWLTIQLCERINTNLNTDYCLKGYRFRYVFNDSLQIFKPEHVVEVYEKKKMVIISFNTELTTEENICSDIERTLIIAFGKTQNMSTDKSLLFDDDIDVKEGITFVFSKADMFKETIHSIDILNVFDTRLTSEESLDAEQFCYKTIKEADEFSEYIRA